MKKVISDGDKGYMLPKADVDEKIRKKFPLLKDKLILALRGGRTVIQVVHCDKKFLKSVAGSRTLNLLDSDIVCFYFEMNVLNELLGIKEQISEIQAIHKKDEWKNKYEHEYRYPLTDDEQYYFMAARETPYYTEFHELE